MRIYILFAFTMITCSLSGQYDFSKVFPVKSNSINYADVIHVDTAIGAKEIYDSFHSWISENFSAVYDENDKSAFQEQDFSLERIVQDDQENFKILLKGIYWCKPHTKGVESSRQLFDLNLQAKQGRYRYELKNLRYAFDASVPGVMEEKYNFDFSEWLSSAAKKGSKKKKKKVINHLTNWCIPMNESFELLITSLKNHLANMSTDEW